MLHVNDNSRGKEILEQRRPIGINVVMSTGKGGGLYAYQLYESAYRVKRKGKKYDDINWEVRRGDNLRVMHGFQDLNGTDAEKKECARTLHPHMEPALRASAILLERVGNLCWDFDQPRKPKKRSNRKKRRG